MSADRDSRRDIGSVGIQHLPVEVLHNILVLSSSSSFPFVCRHFRQACGNASSAVKAKYIFARWLEHVTSLIKQHPCRRHKACKNLVTRHSVRFQITDCTVALIRTNHLDIVTFAAELAICTVKILERVVHLANASLPQCLFPTFPMTHQLPKRLFRRISPADGSASPQSSAAAEASEQSRPRKRRRRRNDAVGDEAPPPAVKQEQEQERPLRRSTSSLAQLKELVWSAAKAPPCTKIASDPASIPSGPIPGPEDHDLILTLLLCYRADASSHQGYPLAMAVHHRAYALAHLLLLFGADPSCKEGLAAQIAIRNGSLAILHLLVTGPSLDVDAVRSLSISAAVPAWSDANNAKSLPKHRPFTLDQTHLRLAIQCRQWELVDYIWHEQQVSPDIACLRLIDKLRQ